MDRKTQIGITRGMWIAIAGLIIAFIVTPIVGFFLSPSDLESINPASLETGEGLTGIFQEFESFNQTLSIVFYAGLVTAFCGVLYSALVWSKWFTRDTELGVSH